jgi:hypothetical protein
MRFLVLLGLATLFLVLLAISPSRNTPPGPYPPCEVVANPVTDPDAYCEFHGSPITEGEYSVLTVHS